MVSKLLGFLSRDSNEKQLKRYRSVVEEINGLEDEVHAASDEALRAWTDEFRKALADGDELDDLMPEAFAVVREAAQRTLGMRHFDAQLIGGAVLHEGKVAEMRTGEGKTLAATLPIYLNALGGGGAHVVTVNDYLARRDAAWMGPVYRALGLSVGCLQHEVSYLFEPGTPADGAVPADMRAVPRREAYAADITYGTNNEFGFDYLRDNMATSREQQVQRPLVYAIVDEVDNILIDEARTPLIISGPAQEPTSLYQTVARVVPRLVEGEDFNIEEKERQVILTDSGISNLERLLNVDNLYDPANDVLTHFVENALRALAVYRRDKDYVVKDREVIIVDEFTGRLMPGRRWADGLHQAIEAKENVTIQRETITYATITLQNYFRMYPKLAGMTGTAVTEAEEFFKVYGLDVVAIPTHMPMIREDFPDLVYRTHAAKFAAVADHIAELHQEGRPVLVGTVSIERSEELSGMLERRGIPHEVLNAKNHESEAHIIAQAGRPGAVTVSTSMAGRGTDIILGGDAKNADSDEAWANDHASVVAGGGLFVIGTERHESRRIDNQLRGRSGRQGDPGETRFYASLEDDIMVRFGQGTMGRLVGMAMSDDAPLESGMLTRTMEMVQGKVESHYFDIRKHLVEYDDVVNGQRQKIYDDRTKVLDEADLKAAIQAKVGKEITQRIRETLVGDPAEWDAGPLLAELATIFPLPPQIDAELVAEGGAAETEEAVLDAAEALYAEREEAFGEETMRAIERVVLLQTVDRLWVQHLTMMSNLRQGIGLYAYGQRDPLVMYKKEGSAAFGALLERIDHDIAHTIFHVAPAGQADGGGAGPRLGAIDTKTTTTVLSKAAGARTSGSPQEAPTVDPSAPRWARRQAARAAGGSKKSRKRKGSGG
ncbi:MAG: preprotein translocase subunit SecA [Chloroflexi bacterium]|nr:preprotein translocase subunit SecA [Chloroflexota bacterium]